MPQGKLTLKKPDRKPKPKRGDQQKLKKGNFVIKSNITKKAGEQAAQQALTKKIVQRIEQTMAARASTDSGGLQVVSAEGSSSDFKPLKTSVLGKAKR